jgi:adenylate cyclase
MISAAVTVNPEVSFTHRVNHSVNILIVDDDPRNLDVLEAVLTSPDYRLVRAANADQALHALVIEEFALLILDVRMPGMSGLELAHLIKQRRKSQHIPIIFLSAYFQEDEHALLGYDVGAVDYLNKPCNPAVLRSKVAVFANLFRTSRALKDEITKRVERHVERNDVGVLSDMAKFVQQPIDVLDSVELQLKLNELNREMDAAYEELRSRNLFLQRMFGTFMSNEVVERLLAETAPPTLGGSCREVTILMSDLREFTPLTERLAPETVVQTLNNYFGYMVEIIKKHEGTIDNIIGDGMLAVFNGLTNQPDHAQRAVACALDMQEAITRVNRDSEPSGMPAVSMGIGINTGEVIVGNIGSHLHMKHSVIGTAVNIADRILDHSIPGQILVSDSTYRALGKTAVVEGRLKVKLKGVSEPVLIHDVVDLGSRGVA